MDVNFFLDLETRVWRALQQGDAAADAALLSEDFLGVYATGYGDRAGHAAALAGGPTVADFHLDQPYLLPLGPGFMLLAYRADYTRTGQDEPEAMYVSSIWREDPEGWRNIFSQDTAESDVAPV
jgi:hypothetical protein